MREDENGLPLCGRSGKLLGVRLPGADTVDVHPDADRNVAPEHDGVAQGMSVTTGDPRRAQPHQIPVAMGGSARCPMFELDEAAIADPLELFRDAPNHAVIRPVRTMSLEEYDRALEATRPHWRKTNVTQFPPLRGRVR
jgi:hypothetical protein